MTRILSALVLLPIVLGVVWFLPPAGTLVLATVAALLAFLEYAGIAEALGARVPRVICAVAVVGTCVVVGGVEVPLELVLLSALLVVGTLAVAAGRPGPDVLLNAGASLLPVIYIGIPLGALAAVRLLHGREAVLLLMATIIVSDSAQYYTGRMFGKRPLAPAISPKKTVEGAVGGIVFGTIAMFAGGLRLFPAATPVMLLLASATVVGMGIVGDLFESLLKRSAGLKDSSTLIPGHGGVLDRIDSWLFAGPVYYVFARYLQV
jgi:phosphatidate cytidylyltransferase